MSTGQPRFCPKCLNKLASTTGVLDTCERKGRGHLAMTFAFFCEKCGTPYELSRDEYTYLMNNLPTYEEMQAAAAAMNQRLAAERTPASLAEARATRGRRSA